jgi:hypothetical protein
MATGPFSSPRRGCRSCGARGTDLERKGFDVVGEFHCRGFDSWGPLWLAGGINRRHPDAQDLDRAADFARRLPRVPARAPARRFAG